MLKRVAFLATAAIVLAIPSLAANNILVENTCGHDIRFLIRYNPRTDVWVNRGWWVAPARGNLSLGIMDKHLIHLKGSPIYVYGYAMDTLGSWSSDSTRDNKTTFEGDEFYLKPMSDQAPAGNGDTLIRFICGTVPKPQESPADGIPQPRPLPNR